MTKLAGWALPTLLGWSAASTTLADSPILFADAPTAQNNDLLLAVIVGLLVVQTLLIGGLQRSRVKNKQAREKLSKSQKALEQRVIERTDKLRAINNQLYEEIAKHEITEELLQETQDYLQSMINSMPSILIGVTREGTVTQWNAAAEQATGIPAHSALGRLVTEVSPKLPIDLPTIRQAIDRGVTQVKESLQQVENGQQSYIDLVVYPLLGGEVGGAVIRIDDVSMRVRFENMMIQNEKMMSLGELAAGMAHEINNPLSAILHGVQNINRRTQERLPANLTAATKQGVKLEQIQNYLNDRDIYKFVAGIKEAGERAAHIVSNMLEFSRTSSRKHQPINMLNLIEHSLELSASHFSLPTPHGKRQIQIMKEFQNNLPMVTGSAAEIQQVVLNILRNAAQCFMGEPIDNPCIRINLRADKHTFKISITDNGPGMSDLTKRHLFEPFYTTKDVGRGTGLGLSVSYFIINEHHDGKIEVESTLGKGSCFTISLQLTESANSTEPSASSSQQSTIT